jgi:hypothetical protein
MRTMVISWRMLVSLGLLATVSMAGCGASRAPSTAGPSNGQTMTPAARPTPTQTASPPAGTASTAPTGPGGIRNLVISSAERSDLTAAFVADKGISSSDVLGASALPGSVYYAYDPATDTYWALAEFRPSSTASLNVKVNFQDGGNIGMFRKARAGPWQVRTPGWPPICSEPRFFPPAVLMAWALPTSAPAGTGC